MRRGGGCVEVDMGCRGYVRSRKVRDGMGYLVVVIDGGEPGKVEVKNPVGGCSKQDGGEFDGLLALSKTMT